MPNTETSERIPPGQQLVAPGKWPVIGERTPASEPERPELEILGLVDSPKTFSLDSLREMPQTEMTLDIHCVTRWSKLDAQFSGVLLADLLKIAAPQANAKYISFVSNSARDHSTSLELKTALELNTLIVLDHDGEPLAPGHGGPIRNIVPDRYFYKSVKWLCKIELLEQDRLGYWEAETGYHNNADPWKVERYMSPTIDRRTAAKLIESRDFSNRDLRSLDASKRDLAGLNAIQALLRNANFSEADLSKSDFTDANLSNAHFRNSNLTGVCFKGTDLEGADLAGANLSGAQFERCSLIGASFCDFDDAGNPTNLPIVNNETSFPRELLAPLTADQKDVLTGLLANGR